MPKIPPNGALADSRPSVAKAKDFKASDIAGAPAIPLFKNPKVTALTATTYSQEYVSDCVPHGFYTQLEYEGIVPKSGMSQLLAYRKRSNYATAGSQAVDMYTQIRNGQSINADAATFSGMTEVAANNLMLVPGTKLLAPFNYYGFENLFFNSSNSKSNGDAIAACASGKAIAIFIFATEAEWSQEYVRVKDQNLPIATAYIRHCVCIVPKGDFTEMNQQWLAVHDSAKFGGRHLRYITYDFFLKRCYYASQVYATGTVPPASSFKYVFTKQLRYKGNNDAKELKALQQALQFLRSTMTGEPYMTPGLFGPFGPQTKKALGAFQTDNSITDPDGQGTNFGPSTRTVMNAKLA